ncbi:hypothetical protein PFISCL1PPCAC_20460 [Pristionchus fissidentatus]|uniref:ADP ribosylation factor n=1 Tax=Pristionchus fissidentatus TaxID=1538716 RepID=A0AAV5WC99_9BILA|nr:hypothetical protein PFISCL1PPCAC_20460 [Pristionchus fissidentatus]
MLTPPLSSSSSTSSSPPPSSHLHGRHSLHPSVINSPPTPPPSMISSGFSLSTVVDRPSYAAVYYDEQQLQLQQRHTEIDAAGWYDSVQQGQLQQLQQAPFRTLQHRRPATTIDRSTRGETRTPLTPLNWEVPSGQIRGRPREIKRGVASVKMRGGSQAPSEGRGREENEGKEKKEEKKEKEGGLRRSARRSLSRSRLIQAVLAVPKRAGEGMRWWRDEEKHNGVEDYLPSSPSLHSSQHSLYPSGRRGSVFLPSAAAAAAPPSPFTAANNNFVRPAVGRPSRPPARTMRVVVVGAKKVGKTAILRQVACIEDITNKPYTPTIEDTYQVLLEDGDKPREILIFHDTAGLLDHGPIELKRPYLQVADAFVLVYSVADHESFNRVDTLKKMIDKHYAKEKKEMPVVVLGNMTDLPGRKVDSEFALNWSQREKVKLFEVTATERNSLIDFVHYIGQRHFHPQKESMFSLSKKLKSEKPNNAILMDF